MKYRVGTNGGVKVSMFFKDEPRTCRVIKYKSENGSFKYGLGENYFHHDFNENKKYLLVGLGKENELTLDSIKVLGYEIGKKLLTLNEFEFEIEMPKLNGMCQKQTAKHFIEGLIESEYKFDKFKTKKEDKKELLVNYIPTKGKEEKVLEGIEEALILMESVMFTRMLVNEPSNYLYPETLAQYAKNELEKYGVKVEIFEEEQIKEMKMEAFLNVAKGSSKKPRLIVMNYNNDDTKDVVALVGKGVTYDTGGYSIKPTDGMKTMFCDMGGAATVIGAIKALAMNKVKTNVMGVIAACENMISSTAYKPGDIISSMKGKTIEIVNTDAEGRLTLADAIYYATSQENVVKVIDLATLTGACLVALGEKYAGVVTNNQDFYNELVKASEEANELVWQLPNNEYFKDMNKSLVADIKNSGGRLGGTISAGLFVGEFLAKDIPWLHIDIAGTAYLSKQDKYLPMGASGQHVKTLYYLLKNKPIKCNCGCN